MKRRRAPLPARQILAIVTAIACLVGIVVLKKRCGKMMGELVHSFDVADGGARD